MFETTSKQLLAKCGYCKKLMGHPDCHHSEVFRQDFMDHLKGLYQEGGEVHAASAILGEHTEGRDYSSEELEKSLRFVRRAVEVNFEIIAFV